MAKMWREFVAKLFAPTEQPKGTKPMKRFYVTCALAAAVALGGWILMAPTHAAPPTVTPSPGYDARLQQQRATLTAAPAPIVSRRVKRHHRSTH
jgi:hypothetical protein